MKKILLFAALVLVSVLLVGCGIQPGEYKINSVTTTVTSAIIETTEKTSVVIKRDKIVELGGEGMIFELKEGNKFALKWGFNYNSTSGEPEFGKITTYEGSYEIKDGKINFNDVETGFPLNNENIEVTGKGKTISVKMTMGSELLKIVVVIEFKQ